MKRIQKFDPAVCRIIRNEMEEALGPIEKKHGVQISVGKMSYTTVSVKVSVELAVLGDDGINQRELDDFRRYAPLYGISPDAYGRELVDRGTRFKLIGFNPRKPKFAVRLRNMANGNINNATEEYVKRMLAAAGG